MERHNRVFRQGSDAAGGRRKRRAHRHARYDEVGPHLYRRGDGEIRRPAGKGRRRPGPHGRHGRQYPRHLRRRPEDREQADRRKRHANRCARFGGGDEDVETERTIDRTPRRCGAEPHPRDAERRLPPSDRTRRYEALRRPARTTGCISRKAWLHQPAQTAGCGHRQPGTSDKVPPREGGQQGRRSDERGQPPAATRIPCRRSLRL